MIWKRCLLLMTALAVNTLVAGQAVPAQGDKSIDESQQEITTDIVPEVPIQAVDSNRTKMGTVAEEPPPVQGDKPIEEGAQETAVNMVSVEPALLQEDGSTKGGEQVLPMRTVGSMYKAARVPPVDSNGGNLEIYRATMGTVAEEPPPVQGDIPIEEGAQGTAMNMVSVEPVFLQEDESTNGGEQVLPMATVAGEPGEPVLYTSMVSDNPPFINESEPVLTKAMVSPDEPIPVTGIMYNGAGVPATPELTSTMAQCPVTLGCCEEDCCGAGTSWQSSFCTIDRDSTGFNGTHSGDWAAGCIDRVCCEEECCSPETKYDNTAAECLPRGLS
jgi:hypothetical protein